MLNKLLYSRAKQSTSKQFAPILDIMRHFGGASGDGVRIRGQLQGSSGLLFEATVGNAEKILKTYPPEHNNTHVLLAEGRLLQYLYSTLLNIEILEHPDSGGQCFIMMDRLQSEKEPLIPIQILSLIEEYSQKLRGYPMSLLPNRLGIPALLGTGQDALQILHDRQALDPAVQDAAHACLQLLEANSKHFPPCICHGDLGPRNILYMSASSRETVHKPIVIDWEEAFTGTDGYDYLYWLSFFANRRYYSADMLDHTPWGREIAKAFLVLILILKHHLSTLQGNTTHRMSCNQRLMEILSLA